MGPVFAAMGTGYVAVAGLILRGSCLLDQLAALYTGGLILAYVVSRLPVDTPLPVEPHRSDYKGRRGLAVGGPGPSNSLPGERSILAVPGPLPLAEQEGGWR